ncbi:hypothetical protein D3C77_277820 [compost metagenome]
MFVQRRVEVGSDREVRVVGGRQLPGHQVWYLRRHRIVAAFDLEFAAVLEAFLEHIIDTQGGGHYRTANAAVDVALQVRPLDDLDAADQVGVDVVAVVGAHVAAVHGQRLFGAIDGQRYPARALDAADVGVQGAAVAGVTAVDVEHALEQVGGGGALVAFDLFLAGVDCGDVLVVDVVVALLVTGLLVLHAVHVGGVQVAIVQRGRTRRRLHLDDRSIRLAGQAVGDVLIGQQLLQCGLQGKTAVDRVAIGASQVVATDVELGTGLAGQQHQRFIQRQRWHVEGVIVALGRGMGCAFDRAGLNATERGCISDQGQSGELNAEAQAGALRCRALLVVFLRLQNRPH